MENPTLKDQPSQAAIEKCGGGIKEAIYKTARIFSLLTALALSTSGCGDRKEIYKEQADEMARSINRGGDKNYQTSFAKEPVSGTCVAIISGHRDRGNRALVFPVQCNEDVLKKAEENK